MKRRIGILTTIALVFMVLLPVSAHAATYSLSETDMSIDVDNSLWYVFTRDNIKDNSELKELGISYNTMYDILYTNEAYMDALLLYEDGGYVEFFVRKRPLDTGVANLSNYEDKDVLEVHHIDSNHCNNDIDNLMILCPICHRKLTLHYYELDNYTLKKI